MIEYFQELLPGEQAELTKVIQSLYRQTFILERKYDKNTGRFTHNREFRICDKHLQFLRAYFEIAGFEIKENHHMGTIYLEGDVSFGEKIPRLATIYLLLLKLLYDEKMAVASSSSNIVVTLGDVSGKAGEFKLLKTLSSVTEIRKTIALLKRYQIVEPMDVLEELSDQTRLIIYPCINAVLLGDDVKELIYTFTQEYEDELEEEKGEDLVEEADV